MSASRSPEVATLQTFYLGLQSNTKAMIDAASGGSINNKIIDEAYELIDTMASNNYSDRTATKKNVGMFAVDQTTALAAQMSSIQQQLSQMMSAMNAPVKNCDFCGGGGHQSKDCQKGNPFAPAEQANYMQNFQRGQGNFNGNQFYNPNWRNHPNLSWSNNAQQPQQQQRFEPQQHRRSPDDMLSKYIEANEARMKNQEASIKNIETQIGQLTNLLTNRVPGALPSDIEKNPRE